jgi:hypothetical protein
VPPLGGQARRAPVRDAAPAAGLPGGLGPGRRPAARGGGARLAGHPVSPAARWPCRPPDLRPGRDPPRAVPQLGFARLAIGAPAAAIAVEELAAWGVQAVVGVGFAGAIAADLAPGDVVVCAAALRDEGTSRHYLPAAPTSGVVFLGFRLSRRPPTERYPYGLERAEDLAGIGIAVATVQRDSVAAACWTLWSRCCNKAPPPCWGSWAIRIPRPVDMTGTVATATGMSTVMAPGLGWQPGCGMCYARIPTSQPTRSMRSWKLAPRACARCGSRWRCWA